MKTVNKLKSHNNIYFTFIAIAILLTIASCKNHTTTNLQQKTWALNQEYSSISIVTTKNDTVSEVSEFKLFNGSIDQDGNIMITIDLASLETNNTIRNQRIQKNLFQTSIYPTADIHTQLKPEHLNIGVHEITFDVDLHGVSAIMTADFMVFEQYGNKIITLHKPLIVQADHFSLNNGIVTLKNLAKLISIDFTVPVHVILSFEQE